MSTFFRMPLSGSVFALALGIFAAGCIPTQGQEDQQRQITRPITVDKAQITGYPDDWTHHHVLFTSPGSEEEAIHQGRYNEWLRTVNDPRYILNALKRHTPVQGPLADDVAEREAREAEAAADLRAAIDAARDANAQRDENSRTALGIRPGVWGGQPTRRHIPEVESKKDWNVPLATGNGLSILGLINLGGALNTAQLMPNVYPAGYTFNPNSTPSCPNNYMIFPTGVAGVTNTLPGTLLSPGGPGTPDIIAFNNIDTGLLSGVTSCGTILTGVFSLSVAPNPTVMWAYNTGGTVISAPVLSLDGSQVAFIQANSSGVAQLVLLKWSSPGNSATVGISVGGLLTIGTSEMINGNEYGYGVANLPLLGGLVTDYPVTTAPTSDTSAAYQSCVAGEASASQAAAGTQPTPCMYVVSLSGSAKVTNSAPFVDYQNGVLYVGDDSGKLHKFTGLAFGEPGTGPGQAGSTAAITEVTPVTLSSTGSALGAPAYDAVSGCVFVGDAAGYLYQVDGGNAGTTKCKSGTFKLNATSAKLASGTANGILDAPMINSSTQAVYVFVSSSASLSSFPSIASGSNAVDEFIPGFASGAQPTTAVAVGTGGSKMDMLDGSFDNVYYSSSNGTGYMYAVGNTEVGGQGTLYQIPITANALGAPTFHVTLNNGNNNTNYAYASPVLEFCNNAGNPCAVTGNETTSGVDLIYFSVYKGTDSLFSLLNLGNVNCSLTLAPGGCLFGVDVHNPASIGLYADYGLPGDGVSGDLGFAGNPCWVTTGMVVDNASTSLLDLNLIGIGSQMYFASMNGNSVPLSSTYNPCQTPGKTGNVVGATQLGQGNLVL